MTPRLLDFHYSFTVALLAKRPLITPSGGAAPPIIGAVADWVWVVLASDLTDSRAQKQHLER
jgi:hypothetical protein